MIWSHVLITGCRGYCRDSPAKQMQRNKDLAWTLLIADSGVREVLAVTPVLFQNASELENWEMLDVQAPTIKVQRSGASMFPRWPDAADPGYAAVWR